MSLKKIRFAMLALLIGAGSGTVAASSLPAQEGQIAEAAGLVMQTLSGDDLAEIQAAIGRRLGVEVIQVRPGTPGAAAGFKEGDIIYSIGGTGVDSAPKAAAVIKASQGDVDCGTLMVNLTTFQLETKTIKLRLGGAAAASPQPANPSNPQPAKTAGNAARATANAGASNVDPIGAYFDLMDFACSQAWNRRVVTPAQDRQRVAALLQQGWNQMDAQAQAQVMALPRAWADLQQSWKTMSESERNKKRAEWCDQILKPNNFFAPPAALQRFTAENNLVAFEFPAVWTGGWQIMDGTPYLFVGPGGAQATWDRVLNTATSPPGALFALVKIDAGMRQLTYEQGARTLVQLLMPGAAVNFKEVQVMPIGNAGAIITLRGKFPGESEERFYWIGITAFGSDKVFAGRMGGPVAQAMELLPGFHHLLATLKLNPPRPAGGGEAYGSWQAAWSRVETASVAYIWKK